MITYQTNPHAETRAIERRINEARTRVQQTRAVAREHVARIADARNASYNRTQAIVWARSRAVASLRRYAKSLDALRAARASHRLHVT